MMPARERITSLLLGEKVEKDGTSYYLDAQGHLVSDRHPQHEELTAQEAMELLLKGEPVFSGNFWDDTRGVILNDKGDLIWYEEKKDCGEDLI